MSNVLRNIPSVNELLDSPALKQVVQRANRTAVVSGVRHFLDNFRADLQNATSDVHVPSPAELAERIARWIVAEDSPNLRPAINATGILLHTGLGRAPLAEAAIAEIADIARGYASVEVDLASGERSQRVRDVERQLVRLTGAEAAAVVNNNAGATMITLAALATGGEVVVSRGQLVEIGGSYRLPDVMEVSGAKLREVGTTNKTRIADYRDAIGPDTAALMRVHPSNFAIVGFTEEVGLKELVELGRKQNLPVIDDVGSGAIQDFAAYGIQGEPVVSESISGGADVVLFSGDKLLGGPQSGIILGKKPLIEKIMRHPLMRALRVDKLTLAALSATLRLHQDRELAERSVPLLILLTTPLENLQHRAERLASQLASLPVLASAEAVQAEAFLGGGSVPNQGIPTWAIALRPAQGSLEELARRLRSGSPSVFARIHRDRLLLDLRSVYASQDMLLVDAARQLEGTVAEQPQEETPDAAEAATGSDQDA
jgi:L-seryl-tRNA(Ser) seleniumtransferase